MKILSLTFGGALAASLAMALSAPAVAAPRVAPVAVQSSPDLVEAQFRSGDRGERWRHGRFERRGGWGYYGGHRGFRDHRPGYRLYNGWWFPPAAFGLMVETRPAPRIGNAHVRWCYDRWKSYRAYDNSYQPSSGPRRQCVSPFG